MNTELIQKLRRETGAGIMDVKKALEESGTDIEKARELLSKRGAIIAGKKSAREAGDGLVAAYIHNGNKIGVLLKLYTETDFVARTDEFQGLARDIAMHIAASDPADKDELLSQEFIKDSDKTIRQLIEDAIAKLGENIRVGDFVRYEL